MTDKLSFTLRFVFKEGDEEKALKLHEALKSFGATSNARLTRDGIKSKKERFKAILKVMNYGEEYTTGKLWMKYAKHTTSGQKTFQRDINCLAVLGLVTGRIDHSPSGKGRTCMWSKKNIYGGEQDEI